MAVFIQVFKCHTAALIPSIQIYFSFPLLLPFLSHQEWCGAFKHFRKQNPFPKEGAGRHIHLQHSLASPGRWYLCGQIPSVRMALRPSTLFIPILLLGPPPACALMLHPSPPLDLAHSQLLVAALSFSVSQESPHAQRLQNLMGSSRLVSWLAALLGAQPHPGSCFASLKPAPSFLPSGQPSPSSVPPANSLLMMPTPQLLILLSIPGATSTRH